MDKILDYSKWLKGLNRITNLFELQKLVSWLAIYQFGNKILIVIRTQSTHNIHKPNSTHLTFLQKIIRFSRMEMRTAISGGVGVDFGSCKKKISKEDIR